MPPTPDLSFALMTHNEVTEFGWLMEVLAPALGPALGPDLGLDGELVILDDHSTPEMVALVRAHATRFAQRRLKRNFGAQRNHLKGMCRGRYILVLDPDEMPDPRLLAALPRILAVMDRDALDVVEIPRMSASVPGRTPVDARTLRFTDDDLRACAPTHHGRLYRNSPALRYVNRVHERLEGYRRVGRLPLTLTYALYHVTPEDRREQNARFYRSIRLRYVDKWRKSLLKRLRLAPPPVRVEITDSDLWPAAPQVA